jgi:hypothetical protein
VKRMSVNHLYIEKRVDYKTNGGLIKGLRKIMMDEYVKVLSTEMTKKEATETAKIIVDDFFNTIIKPHHFDIGRVEVYEMLNPHKEIDNVFGITVEEILKRYGNIRYENIVRQEGFELRFYVNCRKTAIQVFDNFNVGGEIE